MLAKLQDDHEAILALCDRLLPILRAPDMPQTGTLSSLRWQCVRLLTGHLTFLRSFVLDPLQRDPDAHLRTAIRRITDAARRYEERHRAHLARFETLAEAHDWHGYRQSSRDLVEAVQNLVAAERAAMPLLRAHEEWPAPVRRTGAGP